MSELRPLAVETLAAWALAGLERERSVFGLPQRSFWRRKPGLDLSIPVAGGRAATPLGPAAGPHTQLAQNLVTAWLAGARVLELKTIQVRDRLEIPRPCIDAPAEAYNVEWSQELRLASSLEQYATAWLLIHALAARGVVGPEDARAAREGGTIGTHFDASVGYDLAGICSDPVARFLDGARQAGPMLHALRDRLPAAWRDADGAAPPARMVDTVTLSTFHGCPAGEIERIVERLFDRHALNVVIKLNPTLLGHDHVAHLLHDVQRRHDIVLEPAAFARDLQWDTAVGMLARLTALARGRGLSLGIKLTNTLVVRNTRGRLAGEQVYLSGAPLHSIALALADRLERALPVPLPRSFSAGVRAENFADTVACGFAPVTTCTDLLQPTGYRRLPRYLKALEAEMERLGARDIDAFVVARAREAGGGELGTREAGAFNLAGYAARLAAGTEAPPAESFAVTGPRPPLALLDCESCNRCALVCPNAAFFSVAVPPCSVPTLELVLVGGAVERRLARFGTHRESQWAVAAELCNECGNCDTFCPEAGGPHRVKPRLYTSRAGYDADLTADGIRIDGAEERVVARFSGVEHRLERTLDGWRFGNDAIEAELDDAGTPRATRVLAPREGATLRLAHFHALRLLVPAVLAGVNPIAVAVPEPISRPGTPRRSPAPGPAAG
ncbi:MAG TPA: hypothetical protein VI504_11485 [Candidatus Eisenbacteria bacterium]